MAVRNNGSLSIMIINFNPQTSSDRIVRIFFTNLVPGQKKIQAYRIDDDCRWSEESIELLPYEERTVDVLPEFEYQFYSPADSVLWIKLG
jgi:hypothetical protein